MRDLIIIGAGPGGYELALEAASQGLKVTLIEKDALGGTCLNHGCIPTKSFYHTAKLIKDFQEAQNLGFSPLPNWDYQKTLHRKNEIVSQLVGGIKFLLEKAQVEVIHGHGKLISPHQVQVNEQIIEGAFIVIATGSSSAKLPLPGFNLPQVLSSTEMLDLDVIPKKLAIVGGGVIGIEFASIFQQFGSEVEVFEALDTILPLSDREISKRLLSYLKQSGIKFHLKTMVSKIEKTDHLQLFYQEKDQELTTEADVVLVAVGRKPKLDKLGLEEVGIVYDRFGIKVNEHFQTNFPHIYAIGDVTGKMMLAHSATYSGFQVLKHLLHQSDRIDFSILPSCVFTFPEVAQVGLTEEEAKSLDYRVLKSFFRANGKALTINETNGFIKIIVVDEVIRGVHILGPHASDLILEAVSLLNQKTTVQGNEKFHSSPSHLGRNFCFSNS
ncbi:MAG TPA: dihydrolipoyl dehydrogenase [Bacilli bacterium]|nr:dihydrolipoyl dehydrogenase [Bacilli bacterium]